MGLNKHSDWFDPFDPLSTLSANQQRPSERCYPSETEREAARLAKTTILVIRHYV